jgi:hypothetical protein
MQTMLNVPIYPVFFTGRSFGQLEVFILTLSRIFMQVTDIDL